MASPILTARQETFARTFALTRSVADSYRAAYECEGLSPKTIDKRGREVLNAPAVQARIQALVDEAAGDVGFTVAEALRRFLAIAAADPNELVSLKVGCCRYCHGEGHRYQWKVHEYANEVERVERFNQTRGPKQQEEPFPAPGGGLDFDESAPPHPDCPNCHGEGQPRIVAKDTEHLSPMGRLLYGGVKHTNNGPQIIIADRMKALEMATRIIGGFNDNVKVSGELKAMVAAVRLETTDPNEAAKAYQDMIAGKLTTPSN